MSPRLRTTATSLASAVALAIVAGCQSTRSGPSAVDDRTADRRTDYDASVLPDVDDRSWNTERSSIRVPPLPDASGRREPMLLPPPAPPSGRSTRTETRSGTGSGLPLETGGEPTRLAEREQPFVQRVGGRLRRFFGGGDERETPPPSVPGESGLESRDRGIELPEPVPSTRRPARKMPPPAPPVSRISSEPSRVALHVRRATQRC